MARSGSATVGFILVGGAVLIGYEAVQLMQHLKPLSFPNPLNALPQAAQTAIGANAISGAVGPARQLAGQQAFNGLPSDTQVAINTGLARAVQAGQVQGADVPSWQGAMALILQRENNTYNPCAVYGHPNAVCGSPEYQAAQANNDATGLFQVKPSTFSGYVPGGSISNPFDSAYAAIQELLHAWGGNPWAPLERNPYQGY